MVKKKKKKTKKVTNNNQFVTKQDKDKALKYYMEIIKNEQIKEEN